ncbi:MAG: hypothetical protein P4L81_06310 [Candidatus Pacebacteria bacterium]|nr:hypothetical protein [Candidatus Paceibacterota bacterium]
MPPKTKTKLSQTELERIISDATKELNALKQQRPAVKAKKPKVKKSKVEIVFEEDDVPDIRHDRLKDLFPPKKNKVEIVFEEEQRPPPKREKKKKRKSKSPTKVRSAYGEAYDELLGEAVSLGFVPKNRRRVAKATLATFISENQNIFDFRHTPVTKRPNNYEVTMKIFGGVISEEEALRSKNKRSIKQGKDHLINVDESGETAYYKAIRSRAVENVKNTKLNLLKSLVPGQIIKRYNRKGEYTDEWLNLMNLFGLKDYELTGLVYNKYQLVDFIEIINVSRDHSSSTKEIPENYIERRKHRGGDDSSVLTQCHPYISIHIDEEKAREDPASLFIPVFTNEYLKQNFVPNRCVMDCIIEAYSKS